MGLIETRDPFRSLGAWGFAGPATESANRDEQNDAAQQDLRYGRSAGRSRLVRAEVLTVQHENRDCADHRDRQKPARDKSDRSPSACRHRQQDDDRYHRNGTADGDGETETEDTENQRLQRCCTPSSRSLPAWATRQYG